MVVDTKAFYEMLNDEKKHSQATQELLEKYKENKEDLDVLVLLAKFFLVSKKYKEALEYAKKADIVSSSSSYDIQFLLAVVHDNLGDANTALKYIDKSLKLNPNFTQAIEYKTVIGERTTPTTTK